MMLRVLYMLLLMVVLLAIGSQVFAGTDNGILLTFGARSIGMGGVFASLADDPATVFHNPAGLATYQSPNITGEYKYLSQKAESGFISGILWEPVYSGFVGAGYFGVCAREELREGNRFHGVSDRSRHQGLVSYGRQMGTYSLGASLKITRWTHFGESASKSGLDLGILYPVRPGVSFGAVFHNALRSEPDFDYFDVSVPRTFTGGVSVVRSYPDKNWNVTGAAELEWLIDDRSARLHVGCELTRLLANDIRLAGRLGFNGQYRAIGAGIGWTWVRTDVSVSELEDTDLYDGWAFTVSFSVFPRPFLQWLSQRGSASRTRGQQIEPGAYRPSETVVTSMVSGDTNSDLSKDEDTGEPVESELSSTSKSATDVPEHTELFASVEKYYQQRKYQTALDLLSLILKIDPDNQVALNKIKEIKEGKELEVVFKLALGDKLEKEGLLIKSLVAYNRVWKLDSTNVKALAGRKRVENKLGAPQKSAQGVLAYNAGNYRQARDWFKQALLKDPQEPVALEYVKKINSTRTHPISLSDLKADSVSWQWYLEGLEFNRNKEYKNAIEAWQRILKVYPNCPEIKVSVADARARLEQAE
ncbi:MAG: hypothetical protein U9R56_07830 [candidate division Zixibacteria bacterium]|nr:hypothetical protein [candidate division Zixibacteria bacterium]